MFLAALVIAQFTSGIAAQAAGSRLLFAMGRDRVLPTKIFGRLSNKFHTPVFSIISIALVGLAAIFLDVATSTSFINFGAFLAFIAVNISVIVHWAKLRKEHNQPPALTYLIAPLIGVLVIGYLLSQLDSNALILGAIWLCAGLLLLLFLTRGFQKAMPLAPHDSADTHKSSESFPHLDSKKL